MEEAAAADVVIEVPPVAVVEVPPPTDAESAPAPIDPAAPASSSGPQSSGTEKKERRSRWGGKKEEEEQPKKRSRWGAKSKEAVDPIVLAVQLGLPLAMLQQMSTEQQEMLPKIKEKVDEIDLLCGPPRLAAACSACRTSIYARAS